MVGKSSLSNCFDPFMPRLNSVVHSIHAKSIEVCSGVDQNIDEKEVKEEKVTLTRRSEIFFGHRFLDEWTLSKTRFYLSPFSLSFHLNWLP